MTYLITDANGNTIEIGLHDNGDIKYIQVSTSHQS